VGVRIVNRTKYPTPEVQAIVRYAMTGRGRPRYSEAFQAEDRTVDVLPRPSPTDTREGFTPFDRSQPISLWVEAPNRYPQPDAKDPYEELFKSAAHEAWHDRHPDASCPQCEVKAEGYAHHLWDER
jgi:hypothetical protein